MLVRGRPSLIAIITLAALAAACDDSPVSPTPSFSQADVRIGTGATAANGNTLAVHYTGWLFDASKPEQKGLQFETSRGGTSFTFTLGVGQVIEGWDQGIPGMQVGGVRRLVIPPSLAYGATRNGTIPPNAPLVFEIELLSAQ
jgi:FKBP-type peptidyl-prolyl cis-trans isomerase FkpA